MSHVTALKIQIDDLDMLETAVEKKGGKLKRGQKKFKAYYGSGNSCAHAISMPGLEYEVGVTENADGTFGLQFDFWRGGREVLDGITQEYGVQKSIKSLDRLGWNIVSQEEEAGNVVLVARRY